MILADKKKKFYIGLPYNNIKTSIIYGLLPYSTRKKQFERLLSGETEVIVCTDTIGIPDSLLDLDIVDALKTWSVVPGYYQKADVTTIIYLLNRLKALNIKASKSDMLKMATIPFEENNKTVLALWEEYYIAYSEGAVKYVSEI